MINPAQIPDEVVEAAVNAYAGAIWDADASPLDYQHAMTAAIAAALAAWPEMQMRPSGSLYAMTVHAHLVLPLSDQGAPTQGDACNG